MAIAVTFDLDGTLIRRMTCCELLAQGTGHLEQMRQFEALSSFDDLSAPRRQMADWYKDAGGINNVTPFLDQCTWADDVFAGVQHLQAHEIAVHIVSITWEFAVAHLAKKLGVERFVGTKLQSDVIVPFGPPDKASYVQALQAAGQQVFAVGDSAGDTHMLAAADYAIFVGRELSAVGPVDWHLPGGNILKIAQRIVTQSGAQTAL